MAMIAAFLIYVGRLKKEGSSTLSLVVTGQKEVLLGIVIAIILSFILLIILIPGLFERGIPGRVLSHEPANTMHDRTNGLDFMVILNASIGNFVTGSFVSVMLPASLRKWRK